MPWNMNDYPSSMKNLKETVRKKAIDIANSMVDDGYEEGRAIPIATQQAKEWYDNASQSEIRSFKKEGKPTERSPQGKEQESRPELLEKGEHIVSHSDGWAVQAEAAKKPSEVFEDKNKAINRAKTIAQNKGTEVIVHRKDGKIQSRTSY